MGRGGASYIYAVPAIENIGKLNPFSIKKRTKVIKQLLTEYGD